MLPDNRATLLPDGGDFFTALIDSINRTESLLLLEFYIVRSDQAGIIFAEALAALGLGTSKRGDYATPLRKTYTGWAAPLGWPD